ncbi:Os02g0281800, partial [Oryza sativa Japonica Group]
GIMLRREMLNCSFWTQSCNLLIFSLNLWILIALLFFMVNWE